MNTLKKLDLTKCIALSNGKRALENKEIIKDKKHLSTFLKEEVIGVTNIYMVLYRSEKEGFLRINKTLVDCLCELLSVTEQQLVVDM